MKKCIATFLVLLTLLQIQFSVFATSGQTIILDEQSEEYITEAYEFVDDYGQKIRVESKTGHNIIMTKVYIAGLLAQKTVLNLVSMDAYTEAVVSDPVSNEREEEVMGIHSKTVYISEISEDDFLTNIEEFKKYGADEFLEEDYVEKAEDIIQKEDIIIQQTKKTVTTP